MSKHTPGWRLIWHGNEEYPYPFDVEIEGGTSWIARDGTVSSKAHAILMVAAPELYAALRRHVDADTPCTCDDHIAGPPPCTACQDRAALAKADGRTPR